MRLNLLLISTMLADGAQPELVVHKRPSGHDTGRKLCIARRTNLTVVGDERLAARAFRLSRTIILWAISAENNPTVFTVNKKQTYLVKISSASFWNASRSAGAIPSTDSNLMNARLHTENCRAAQLAKAIIRKFPSPTSLLSYAKETRKINEYSPSRENISSGSSISS